MYAVSAPCYIYGYWCQKITDFHPSSVKLEVHVIEPNVFNTDARHYGPFTTYIVIKIQSVLPTLTIDMNVRYVPNSKKIVTFTK